MEALGTSAAVRCPSTIRFLVKDARVHEIEADPIPTATSMDDLSEDADDVGELADIVGFHIRLAHGAVYRHFTETFTDLDLTQKQVSALWLIDDHPGIAQTAIAARTRMDRATTMAIINRLQGRGYLRRARSLRDGRKQALSLTDEGRTVLAGAKQAVREHEDWLKSRYSEKEVGLLIELLTRLHE